MRIRQHRLVLAFYLSVVFAIALSLLQTNLSASADRPLPSYFLIPTILMMVFAIIGFRSVFPLPISLTANWVLRITQLRPSQNYIAATKRFQLLFAVLPVWMVSAFLSLSFRPWHQVFGHLTILALLGYILAELSLIGFYKVP